MSLCVFSALWYFLSLANLIWLHTRGPNITHWGSGLIAETCLAFFAYRARVPERIIKTPEIKPFASWKWVVYVRV
ncbi:hypothetical protein F5882DRAFT_412507 [Hyaloscypha sp. PMI_1271]|nr:hypothetical protein F5882DRAFT_412507 [Hyaloscypha sp. PMI_1271]